jgi:hypothetical protein
MVVKAIKNAKAQHAQGQEFSLSEEIIDRWPLSNVGITIYKIIVKIINFDLT